MAHHQLARSFQFPWRTHQLSLSPRQTARPHPYPQDPSASPLCSNGIIKPARRLEQAGGGTASQRAAFDLKFFHLRARSTTGSSTHFPHFSAVSEFRRAYVLRNILPGMHLSGSTELARAATIRMPTHRPNERTIFPSPPTPVRSTPKRYGLERLTSRPIATHRHRLRLRLRLRLHLRPSRSSGWRTPS